MYVLLAAAPSFLPAPRTPAYGRVGLSPRGSACAFFGPAQYVDPLAPKGLEQFAGSMTSRVWYLPPDKSDWAALLFCARHEAIRHELLRLERLVPVLQYKDKADPAFDALEELHANYCDAAIRFTHQLEEEALWPAIGEVLEVPADIQERTTVGGTYRTPVQWTESDYEELREAFASHNVNTIRQVLPAFAEKAGSLMEEQERRLAALLRESGRGPEWGEQLQAKLDEFAAAHPFGATMQQLSVGAAQPTKLRECVGLASGGGEAAAARAALLQRVTGESAVVA